MNLLHKSAYILITMSILSVITVSGCGSTLSGSTPNSTNAVSNTTTSSTPSNPTTSGSKATSVSIKDGVTNLLTLAKDLKTDISAGDQTKVKENGPKLEDIWSSFEDNVKPKYPDLYAKVEQFLDPTVAGSKADTLDKQVLLKLDDGLIQALTELSQKAQ